MFVLNRVLVACAVLVLWSAGPPLAASAGGQDLPPKLDSRGPVAVRVTLLAPATGGAPLKVRVALNTHSVGLDDIAFDRAVALRGTGGSDVAPTAVEQATGGGHHRQAVVVFPPVPGGGEISIVVKGVGGVKERVFTWRLAPGR